jgi:hypothetical protein
MKKLLILIFILISFSLKSQTIYPSYYIKNGDTLGVIITIQQAQKIDNDYDLLSLLKEYKTKQDKLDSSYLVVIDNYGKEVATLKLKISTLEDLNNGKNLEIANLKSQIDGYKQDKLLSDLQLAKKDTIISNYKVQNIKLKVQRTVAFGVGGGLTIVGIILLLFVKK